MEFPCTNYSLGNHKVYQRYTKDLQIIETTTIRPSVYASMQIPYILKVSVQGIAAVPQVDGTGERLALHMRGEILAGVGDEGRDLADFAMHNATGAFDILLVQAMEVRAGSTGAILASCIGVL